MSAPTCRGCNARIRWIKTRSGKSMPVDPEKLQEWVIEGGFAGNGPRITLVTEDGETVTGRQAWIGDSAWARNVEGYIPHWATCPTREAFGPGGELR